MDRLAIPYITPSGVVDIRFRAMNGADPKYMGMPGAKTSMFNAQVVLTASDYICVTEGEIDCITLRWRCTRARVRQEDKQRVG